MSSHSEEHGWQRGFWSLIATQFQGAFNDTALKNLVIFLVLAKGIGQGDRELLELAVGALFSIPFILFSMSGGYLADRYSKRSVAIFTKVFEVMVVTLAVLGLARDNFSLQLAAVFLVSTQGALFGPTKYGLLPEILPQKLLSWGNGVIELGTFVAIIAGGFGAAVMSQMFKGRQGWSGLILFGCTAVGLLCSLGITRVPPADPTKKFKVNPFDGLWPELRAIKRDHPLWLAVVGNTYFWFLAALLQFNIFIYAKDVLHTSDILNGALQASVAIGIGLGSLAAGYLSGNQIEYGLIPLGSLGMTVVGAVLGLRGLSLWNLIGLLAGLGFFAGFFAVPIAAMIQHRPDENKKGKSSALPICFPSWEFSRRRWRISRCNG